MARNKPPDSYAVLRQQAEERASQNLHQWYQSIETLSTEEVSQLVHELRVHQIELEMQNEELRSSQLRLDSVRQRYFDLYELAPVGYFTLNEQGLILQANLTATTLLEVNRAALIKQRLTRFIVPADQDTYYLHRKQLIEGNQPQACELRMVKGNGSPLWGEFSAVKAADENGATIVRVTLSDISKRKQIEELLREREMTLSAIFEQAAVGVALTESRNGMFQKINQKYCDIVGYSKEEMLSLNFLEITHPDDLQKDLDNMRLLLEGKIREFSMEKRHIRKDGSPIWVNLTVSPMWQIGESPKYHIAVIEDITQRKQAEAEARNRLEEIAHYSRLSIIDEMATEIAHELNQPLTTIASYGNTLMRLLQTGEWKMDEVVAGLENITQQALRAGDIIRHLRDFSRKESTHQARYATNELIGWVLQLLGMDIHSRGIEVVTKLSPDLPAIWTDKVLLEQVLLNLIHNAMEAISHTETAHQRLTIKTRLLDRRTVEIEVSDSGPGIAAAQREKIFSSFYTTKPQGLGMGLSISRSIIESNGGRLWLASPPGEGATFKLTQVVAYGESADVD